MSVPGRNLGLTASIIAVILPVVAIAGLASLIFSLIAAFATRSGTILPGSVFGFSIGLAIFILVLIILAIIEFVAFVVSIYQLSQYYFEPAIFSNLLYAILVAIVSIIVTIILQGVFIFASIAQFTNTPPSTPLFSSLSFLVIIIVTLGLSIVSGFFIMSAFNKLKDKSGIDSFGTAGILYMIGSIIPIIGWIAWIFAAIGFHRLKPTPLPSQSYPPKTLPPVTQIKYCPNCGKQNPIDSNYCMACGNPLK